MGGGCGGEWGVDVEGSGGGREGVGKVRSRNEGMGKGRVWVCGGVRGK